MSATGSSSSATAPGSNEPVGPDGGLLVGPPPRAGEAAGDDVGRGVGEPVDWPHAAAHAATTRTRVRRARAERVIIGIVSIDTLAGLRAFRARAFRRGRRRVMEAHELRDLIERRRSSGKPYLEFVRVPSLSVGLYVLEAGAVDRQQPHGEDEVYYVIEGRSRMTVGDEVRDVEPGSVVFVAATVPHRFHDIVEELRILVFFAPPEDSVRR
jgi:mannose-6-phosphate isomerase-like protein (cupin superfamily)